MSRFLLGPSSMEQKERIHLPARGKRRTRLFAVGLICLALLPAAVALFGVWMSRNGEEWFYHWGSFLSGGGESTEAPPSSGSNDPTDSSGTTHTKDPQPLPVEIPAGAIPIRDMDLSASHLGDGYFHNETFLSPNTEELRQADLSSPVGDEPLVLVLHTHASESYRIGQNRYFEGDPGDVTCSEDPSENVISIGKILCDTLGEEGIGAIHCTVMHDAAGYGSAYDAALQSIRFYLGHYPSIRYVIDLHRDAVIDAEGNYIRSLCTLDGEACAQVMAVVGSPAGGEACPGWEGNLALAIQLQEKLNTGDTKLCRPVSLRNHTYNQELAPYSLLLEIGTGANTREEAELAAVEVGKALAELIRGQ